MVNWANLPRDCLITIVERFKLMEDYAPLGFVCKAWQATATKENFKGIPLWQGRPGLMLAPDKDDHYREIYSLFEDRVVTKIFLPETKDKKYMEVSFGWLLTFGTENGNTTLLNPFNGDEIQLPHPNTTEDFDKYEIDYCMFYRKGLLSSAPCQNSQDFVLMVIEANVRFLSFWRPGDRFWTRISTFDRANYDLVYYKGQFYAITVTGRIVVCDISGPHPRESQIVAQLPSDLNCYEPYIMESNGSLLVVKRYGVQLDYLADRPNGCPYYKLYLKTRYEDEIDVYGTYRFQVLEVDLVHGVCNEILDIGDRTIFLGHSASVCINQASKFPEVKANHIYFTDDYEESYLNAEGGGGRDMGVYNLADGSITPHFKGSSLSLVSPPVWVMPCSSCMTS